MLEISPAQSHDMRELLEEYGFSGYILGEVIEVYSWGAVTREINLIDSQPRVDVKQRPWDFFPKSVTSSDLAQARFSVAMHIIDHEPGPYSGAARDTVHEMTVYGDDNPEENSFHAVVIPVRAA